jgi:hypothetical protein
LKKEDLRHLNVYAEVRGKYARPPPVNYKHAEIPLLTPKENSLVIRPSTAGSLKPRSFSYSRNPVLDTSIDKKSEVNSVKQYNKKYRTVAKEPSVKQEIDRIVIDHPNQEDYEKNSNPDDERQETENLQSLDENNSKAAEVEIDKNIEENEVEKDKTSQYSQLTTTSQRKYIQELEGLLRQEKLRRIKLEESLKKVMEENKP